jgi:hypothetical protein
MVTRLPVTFKLYDMETDVLIYDNPHAIVIRVNTPAGWKELLAISDDGLVVGNIGLPDDEIRGLATAYQLGQILVEAKRVRCPTCFCDHEVNELHWQRF